MKKSILISLFFCLIITTSAQVVKDYNPEIQKTTRIQYFKPAEPHLFTGDCMPYFHDGTFYLYWLIDEGHHSGLNGLGGHQWALSTSRDLINWTHYPVALGIEHDWEKSICTGSVIAEEDTFYAFYSTRLIDNGHAVEQLSYAISKDQGITYSKQGSTPFFPTPTDCEPSQFRDPKIFKDKDGLFHLFISGYKKDPVLGGQGGYLAHLTSTDLKNWTETTPILTGQPATPECSDYFEWNGWYYLVYSVHLDTYYLKSRNPYGPWEWPVSQPLVERWANVYKTAPFHDGRRIAVAFIGGKWENKDSDGPVFGGNILLRELVQEADGTLYTKFVEEVLPQTVAEKQIVLHSDQPENVTIAGNSAGITATQGLHTVSLDNLPDNCRITLTIDPKTNYDEAGLFLKATDKHQKGYKFELNPDKRLMLLHNTAIEAVEKLDKLIEIDIIMKDDMIDININNQRSIINRLAEQKGNTIFLFAKNGQVDFKDIHVYSIE